MNYPNSVKVELSANETFITSQKLTFINLSLSGGARRSRSAPARTPDSPPGTGCLQSPLSCRKTLSPPPQWAESSTDVFSDNPLEVRQYTGPEVDRVYKRRIDELRVSYPVKLVR